MTNFLFERIASTDSLRAAFSNLLLDGGAPRRSARRWASRLAWRPS